MGENGIKHEFLDRIHKNAANRSVSDSVLDAVVHITRGLSTRQLCILALVGRSSEFGFRTALLNRVNLELIPNNVERETLRTEVYSLASLHRLLDYDPQKTVAHAAERVPLTKLGETCYDLLGLGDWPPELIRSLLKLFS